MLIDSKMIWTWGYALKRLEKKWREPNLLAKCGTSKASKAKASTASKGKPKKGTKTISSFFKVTFLESVATFHRSKVASNSGMKKTDFLKN